MPKMLLAALVLVGFPFAPHVSRTVAPRPETTALVNGRWFDGTTFKSETWYVENGRFTRIKPKSVGKTINLKNGYVVPPFAEAHNHNLDSEVMLNQKIKNHLKRGVFYVQNPNDLYSLTGPIRNRFNRPESVDATFSHGGLTASGGHPVRLYEGLVQRGFLRVEKEKLNNDAYYLIDDKADFDRLWPRIKETKPDFIKIYLLFSEDFEKRRDDPRFFGAKGLDPALAREIVKAIHADGLRVAAHLETAADFHAAVEAGVDMAVHLPGYFLAPGKKPADYELSETDVERAGKQGMTVVTTTGLVESFPWIQGDMKKAITDNQARNLRLLAKHGVRLAIGSDNFMDTSISEVRYLRKLGVFDDATLLRMWCEATPRAIFPDRKIGRFEEGYEAAFLVLEGNPLEDFSNIEKIRLAFKQGFVLNLE